MHHDLRSGRNTFHMGNEQVLNALINESDELAYICVISNKIVS